MGSTISKFTLANALRPLNLDVCPHIKMNDPVVLKSLPEDYPMSAVDLDRKDSCLLRECAVCQTEFGYNFGLPSNGRIILRFVVMRNLDDFEGVTDPAWISQLSYPGEFATLENAWNACPVDPSIQETRFDVDIYPWRTGSGKGWAHDRIDLVA